MKGAETPSPYKSLNASGWQFDYYNDVCPKGHYCQNGTSSPEPCPIGRYSENSGLKKESECQPCPPGKYCESSGLKELKDPPNCDAGYVCVGGSSTATPTDGNTGYKCPKGFYCPPGRDLLEFLYIF